MTEDQIENAVSRRTDGIDARYMRGALTEAEYQAEMKALNAWAEAQYAAARKAGE